MDDTDEKKGASNYDPIVLIRVIRLHLCHPWLKKSILRNLAF